MKKAKKLAAVALTAVMAVSVIGSAAAAYVVKPGDNLSKIAAAELGSATKWKEIYEANKDQIKNPNMIYVGQTLTLPGEETKAPAQEESLLRLQFDGKTYSDVPVKEVTLPETDPNYYKELRAAEIYNFKLIRNIPTLYDAAAWNSYMARAGLLSNVDPENIGKVQQVIIKNAKDARDALVQKAPASEAMWYIWGDEIPMYEDEVTFTEKSYDNADMKPFLVPYVLKDQTKAKGNLIVIAGGGYSERNNSGEGYPIAAEFNKLGYNTYVLQRRVAPYGQEDIWMDLQRAIRYLRYNAEKLELGGMDCMMATGFSGGSMTILGQVTFLYGDVQPTIYDKDYTPDAVDAMNADLDVVFALYGPTWNFSSEGGFEPVCGENPNVPDMFICVGEEDRLANTSTPEGCWTLARTVREKGAKAEVHTFATVGHGFGVGMQNTNSMSWIAMADQFTSTVMGRRSFGGPQGPAMSIDNTVLADKYTKYTRLTWKFPFGDSDMIIAANDDLTEVYVTFVAFNIVQIVEIATDEAGKPVSTFDASGGFMSGDVPAFYAKAQETTNWLDASPLHAH